MVTKTHFPGEYKRRRSLHMTDTHWGILADAAAAQHTSISSLATRWALAVGAIMKDGGYVITLPANMGAITLKEAEWHALCERAEHAGQSPADLIRVSLLGALDLATP